MTKRKKKERIRVRDAFMDVQPWMEDTTRRHIQGLGFEYINDYFDWCKSSGFKARTRKGYSHFSKEREEKVRQVADIRLVEDRIKRKPKNRIKEILHGKSRNIDDRTRNSAKPLLEHIYNVATDLLDSDLIDALMRMANHSADWIRPLSGWKPKSHNRHVQLGELARHLFAKYPIPRFMDSAWLENDNYAWQIWFLHLGLGGNIRTVVDLPVPLTKKMAHYFLKAPNNYDPHEAIRYGQIMTMKGTPRLVDAANAARTSLSERQNDFWISVYRFFIDNAMLDIAQFGPVVDYLSNQKYGGERVFVAPGVVEEAPPPQPNLSMHRRDPGTLLRQVQDWHTRLGKAIKGKNLQWESCGIGEFELTTGTEGKSLRIWTISEILNQRDLIKEGKDMRHCVASYAGSCSSGRVSIWTLEVDSFKGKQKLATIEVNKNKNITQTATKDNKKIDSVALSAIRRWATKEKLHISKYARF